MILVDTTVWIDFFRGTDSPFRKRLHDLIDQEEDIGLTSFHVTEILQGIRNDLEFKRTQRLILRFPVFSPSHPDSYIHAARIYRSCLRKDKTVRKTMDCLIAAVAIEADLPLFHNDRDFDTLAACTPLKTWP